MVELSMDSNPEPITPKTISFKFRRFFSSTGQQTIDDHLSGRERMTVSVLDKQFANTLRFAEYMTKHKYNFRMEVMSDADQISTGVLTYHDENLWLAFQSQK